MGKKIALDYSKLRGRIREKQFLEKEFAEKMGMHKNTLSKKLNKGEPFDIDEAMKASEILGINIDESFHDYFFTMK